MIARPHHPQPHPNIVLFAIKAGYEGKIPGMVLEYIESRHLRDLLLYREPLLTDNVIISSASLPTSFSTSMPAAIRILDIKPAETSSSGPTAALVLIDSDSPLPCKRFSRNHYHFRHHYAYVPLKPSWTILPTTALTSMPSASVAMECSPSTTLRRRKSSRVRAAQIDPKISPVPIRQHTPNVPAALASPRHEMHRQKPGRPLPDMVLVLATLNRLCPKFQLAPRR